MKIRNSDKVFSWYIRLRDGRCLRCQSPVRLNDKGLPISHTVSHYYGRVRESTRIEPDNCICLCMPCARIWSSDVRNQYDAFMTGWLGEERMKTLMIQANSYQKRDEAMSYLIAKGLLESLNENT